MSLPTLVQPDPVVRIVMDYQHGGQEIWEVSEWDCAHGCVSAHCPEHDDLVMIPIAALKRIEIIWLREQ
jgi:hypothetical protein